MWLKVFPAKTLKDELIVIPSSKPETQRAIFSGAFADGTSRVFNDLRCGETSIMKRTCKSLGVAMEEKEGLLKIKGEIDALKNLKGLRIINCLGSGLIVRIFSVLGSASPNPIVITGDNTLRSRIMRPLFCNLEKIGVHLEYLAEDKQLPIINMSDYLPGGKIVIPGNISSQFITAFLLTAPFARDEVEIHVEGEVYSKPYIMQTLQAMKNAGIEVKYSDSYNYFKILPQIYLSCDTFVTGDYTSASYALGKAVLLPGITRLKNMSENSLQGEKTIVDILRQLGLRITFDEENKELMAENRLESLRGDFEFNTIDSPNIVPTLAAIGSFVEGRFRVVGASITRLHKSSRVEAMIVELRKAGVNISPIYKNGVVDGFEIYGKNNYEGGVTFSSWGDHRIFMSLFVFSLRSKKTNYIDGFADVDCSFPGFLDEFGRVGVEYSIVDDLSKG